MTNETSESLPVTEQDNPRTKNLSSLSAAEIVELMNEEDASVAVAVRLVLPDVVAAIEETVARLSAGGKLFYIGTGTSGRLGVLDASEIPPTFGVDAELVQGVIAGGYEACYRAVEASEDDPAAGERDLQARHFSSADVLVGIAASGRTPYTVAALSFARSIGAFTVGLTCVPDSPITRVSEICIVPIVGPEVVTGSSRLKAGTAQKMVLNMISTATMVRLGYVKGNRMSNLQARNRKLRDRAVRIINAETGLDQMSASAALAAASGDLRVALVMIGAGCDIRKAKQALESSNEVVDQAIEFVKHASSI